MEIAVADLQQIISEALQPLLEEIQELKAQSGGGSAAQKTLPLHEAWKVLGYRNYQCCWRKVKSGHYRANREAIDRRGPSCTKPDWYLDVAACEKRDRTMAGKRK